MNGEAGIPYLYMRGGTSKGGFLDADAVPEPGPELDDLLLRIMGSPDPMQIDGLGGTHSSTSKVVLVDAAQGVIGYRFAQIGIDSAIVDWSGNCGNLTTAVGPYAILVGLVRATAPVTPIKLHNRNTGVDILAEVPVTADGSLATGTHAIPGVPGVGAPIVTRYLDPSRGRAFPTGNAIDRIDTADGPVAVSIVNVSHPYVFVSAETFGGVEWVLQHTDDAGMLHDVESLRASCAVAMGVADDPQDARSHHPATPRIVLFGPSADPTAEHMCVAFSMGRVHHALPMTAALCGAGASRIPGTLLSRAESSDPTVVLRHRRGVIRVEVETRAGQILSVGITRTARRLASGTVFPAPPLSEHT